jgi:ABC-type uncharacterized transport system substrate-binding protein
MNRRDTLLALAIANLVATVSGPVARASTSKVKMFHLLYLDEPTPEGEMRFARVRQAFMSTQTNDDTALSLFPVDFNDSRRIASRAAEFVKNKSKEGVIFLCPNGITTEGVQSEIAQNGSRARMLFAIHSDPVATGIVDTMVRPGRRATGFTYHYWQTPKLVEMARLMATKLTAIGLLVDDYLVTEKTFIQLTRGYLSRIGIRLVVVNTESKHFKREELEDVVRFEKIRAWISLDTAALREKNFSVIRTLTDSGAFIITNDTEIVDAGALSAVEPVVASPYEIWVQQFRLIQSGYPIEEIPVEQPRIFRRAFNLDAAAKLQIKLTRAQLASFDVLYSARNKRS